MFSQRLGSSEQGKWVGGQDSRIHPQAGGGSEPGLPPQLSPGAHLKQSPTPTSGKSRRPGFLCLTWVSPTHSGFLVCTGGREGCPVFQSRSPPLSQLQQTARPGRPVSPTGKSWLHPWLPKCLLTLTPQTVPVSGVCVAWSQIQAINQSPGLDRRWDASRPRLAAILCLLLPRHSGTDAEVPTEDLLARDSPLTHPTPSGVSHTPMWPLHRDLEPQEVMGSSFPRPFSVLLLPCPSPFSPPPKPCPQLTHFLRLLPNISQRWTEV